MSSDYNIEMSTDNTLELDAIIQEWDAESNSVIGNIEYEDSDSTVHNLTGIQTNTAIFDPQKAGKYTIPVNGQELTVNVTKANAIPDSKTSRESDDNTFTDNADNGIAFEVGTKWEGKIQGKLSSKTNSGADTARITRLSDGKSYGSTDIASLTGGDIFTISLTDGLVTGDTYLLQISESNGNNFTYGYRNNNLNFPYPSPDGNITITNGAFSGGTIREPRAIVTVGNINL